MIIIEGVISLVKLSRRGDVHASLWIIMINWVWELQLPGTVGSYLELSCALLREGELLPVTIRRCEGSTTPGGLCDSYSPAGLVSAHL